VMAERRPVGALPSLIADMYLLVDTDLSSTNQ